MKRVCVFCGSSPGADPAFLDAARALGTALGRRGLGLVYGGASVGVMGAVADAALAAGAEVVGVIPAALASREIAHPDLHALHIVGTMHERKAMMADLSDGFIALPGGIGTLDEMAEALTWVQLGIHGKPCGFLNPAGFWHHLLAWLDHAVATRFVRPEFREVVLVDSDPESLLEAMHSWVPKPIADKWMDRKER